MLPTKLTRAAHLATASPPLAICHACLTAQRTHQRRHSSSKTSSSSADRYSNKPAGPATKAAAPTAAEEEQPSAESRTPQRSSKGRSRVPRRGSASQDGNGNKKAIPVEPVDQFASLPSVPSVQSLSESGECLISPHRDPPSITNIFAITELSLSNFFSLHRPLSITHTFPPTTSAEDFSKIFNAPAAQQDPWANGNSAERRPEDVIYTLNSTIENLENNANTSQTEAEGVRWEIIHESPSNANSQNGNGNVHHLDGQPRLNMSLEDLVAQFKPFRAPPPPQAFPE